MKILALDIAKTTGWAISKGETTIVSGSIKFTQTDFGELAFAFKKWISGKLDRERPDLVAYEAPVVKHAHAAKILIGLSWMVVLACQERGIPCVSVNNTSVKKFFVGAVCGKDTKPYPVTVEAERRGHCPQTTDEADAIAILYYVRTNNPLESGSGATSDRKPARRKRNVSRDRGSSAA